MAAGLVFSPSVSVNGFMEEGKRTPAMDYLDTDVKVGGYTVGGGYKNHLERFYSQASPEDKARCLELLTSLDIGAAAKQQTNDFGGLHKQEFGRTVPVQQRPRTAMAALSTDRPRCSRAPPLGPYTTTYKREYAALSGQAAQADAPLDTRAYQASYELSAPIGNSTYESEFYQKLKRKTTPIRTGSSSGNRRNNPHPLETFMNWRLPPRPMAEQQGGEWAGELTDEILDAVCRGKIRSTYQQDYLGIPQGVPANAPVNLPEDWKSKVAYSLASSTRRCYQEPSQQQELKGNTTRYGCNRLKGVPANGVVPTVSSRQMHLKNRTSYEMDYEGRADGPQDIRDLGRTHAAAALSNQAGVPQGPGGEDLSRMLQTLGRPARYSRSHSSASGRISTCSRPGVPLATQRSSPSLRAPSASHAPSPSYAQSYVSTWVGPM